MKNAFADTFKTENQNEKNILFSKIFSYIKFKTELPRFNVKNSDAFFEVKKNGSLNSEIQLNSSHPKAKLF